MKQSKDEHDIFGLAVYNYFENADLTPIKVHVEGFDPDEIPVDYLFRTWDVMPKIEQIALQSVTGKILDVGCCTGAHALILQEQNQEVYGIDTSKASIKVAKKRGLNHAEIHNFYDLPKGEFSGFDSVLFLMNGIGIAKNIDGLAYFFTKLKHILAKDGYALLDSTDLKYLFKPDEFDHYYGEMQYKISYKGLTSEEFEWLYISKELLEIQALKSGFSTEILYEEDHSFLAKLKPIA